MTDVIILSNSPTPELQAMTQNAITTCYNNAGSDVNIIVIEQTGYHYLLATTIYKPGKFNFNEFANYGVKLTTSEKIVLANNDLIFYDNWLSELLKTDYDVASSFSPISKMGITNFSAWCFIFKRSIWEQIGGFDEDFEFLCADNSFMEQLKKINIKPVLVHSSIVEHIEKKRIMSPDWVKQIKKFNTKYSRNLFGYGRL